MSLKPYMDRQAFRYCLSTPRIGNALLRQSKFKNVVDCQYPPSSSRLALQSSFCYRTVDTETADPGRLYTMIARPGSLKKAADIEKIASSQGIFRLAGLTLKP